jgi:hypothetical protein
MQGSGHQSPAREKPQRAQRWGGASRAFPRPRAAYARQSAQAQDFRIRSRCGKRRVWVRTAPSAAPGTPSLVASPVSGSSVRSSNTSSLSRSPRYARRWLSGWGAQHFSARPRSTFRLQTSRGIRLRLHQPAIPRQADRSLSRGETLRVLNGSEELYDLVADPRETDNLADDESLLLRVMRGRLEKVTAGVRVPESVVKELSPKEQDQLRALGHLAP